MQSLLIRAVGRSDVRQTISVDFWSKMKVKELKERIEQQEGIAQKQQKLVFAGKQLSDDVTLGQYNIKAGSQMHIILKSKNDCCILCIL